MNYEDIVALVHAGYTKDDIAAMGAAAPATPAPEPEPPAEPPETTAMRSPDAVPTAQPVNATEQLLQQLLGGMTTLTAAVQAQNRAGITGATPPKSNADLAREATARLAGIPYDKE